MAANEPKIRVNLVLIFRLLKNIAVVFLCTMVGLGYFGILSYKKKI